MLHTLLLVLKIIGITLLTILAIVVLLLCVVLFVPLRYRGQVRVEESLEDLFAEMKFSWLFPLVRGNARYSERILDWKICIAWKKISQDMVESDTEKEDLRDIVQEQEEAEIQEEQVKVDGTEPSVSDAIEQATTKTDSVEDSTKQKREKEIKKKESKIRYKIQKLCDKIKKIKQTKDVVIGFLADEIHQDAWCQLKRELVRILVYLKPKKIKGNLRFGFDDPYKTGVVLAVLSVLYPVYQENLNIYPDFEAQIIKGGLSIKGKIRTFFFVKVILILLLNRNVRRTYKDIKKLEL